ncbi:MAG: S8 family serine peptidase [Bacteroidales bacterium]|jgi:subtilisin family serine protease|nr:S8 family serine peptidase [Bacteroidales bacterium]
MKKIFLFLMVSVFSITTVFATATDVYVRFKSNVSVPKVTKNQKKVISKSLPVSQKILDKYNVAPQARSMSFMHSSALERTFKLSVPDGADVDLFMQELREDTRVEMVERVPESRIFMVPNDTFYGTISNHNLKWHLDYINAEQAWDLASGNPNIIVAVVDNAVYAPHEDLYIADSLQYDMVDDTVGISYPLGIDPSTSLGRSISHGTHCAGNIAAINNNGIGIASLASGVTLMGCGGCDLDNPEVVANAYDGVIWAAEHNAKVISCSWGNNGYSRTHEEIMLMCYEKGIIVVAAAGNDGVSDMHYPAAYKGVISVASTDSDHSLSYFSNRGRWVTVAAPGGFNISDSWFAIFSTVYHYSRRGTSYSSPLYHKRYDDMSGTSMACPIVSSLIALMLSKDSTLTVDQIVTILQNSAQDKEFRLDINSFSGTIDAAAAITAVTASYGKRGNAVRSLSAVRIRFDSVCIKWSAPEDGFTIRGYSIYRNNVLLDSCYADTVLYDIITTSGIKSYTVFPVYQNADVLQVRSFVNVDIPKFYTLSLSSSEGGSVASLSEGFPRYQEDVLVVVSATPDTGYTFVEWSGTDGISSVNMYYALRMTKNISLHGTFAPSTAVEEIDFDGIGSFGNLKIFPNPAADILTVDCGASAPTAASSSRVTDVVTVDCDFNFDKIDVFDLTGRKIFTEFNSQTINVSSLKNGIYFLKVTLSRDGLRFVKTIKFIKSND